MAKTYPVGPLRVYVADDPDISFAERQVPEAVSQTYQAGAPLKLGTNGVAEWVSNADAAIFAWSLIKGQNLAAVSYNLSNADPAIGTLQPTMAKVLLATPNFVIEGNLLAASAAAYVLLAADFGASKDLIKRAALYTQGGVATDGWYIQNTASAATVAICDFFTQDVIPTSADRGSIPGDTSARVQVRVLPGKSVWF